MPVDSFKYVSPLIKRYYSLAQVRTEYPIPWTPLRNPLAQSRFALVTSGGLYHKNVEPPFDLQGESLNPTWGDPSFRTLPSALSQPDLGASHHHINTSGVLQDINILLPLDRFKELAAAGQIASLADSAYSFMGYQGFPSQLDEWKEMYGPQVAQKMLSEDVDCVFLTTA